MLPRVSLLLLIAAGMSTKLGMVGTRSEMSVCVAIFGGLYYHMAVHASVWVKMMMVQHYIIVCVLYDQHGAT